MSDPDSSRRDFIKKVGYVTPAIITLQALPSFASAGSGWGNSSPKNPKPPKDPKPPKNR